MTFSKRKYVYVFGCEATQEPTLLGRNLLGGKGIGLAEMSALGLPVPPGFTITTEACRYYRIHKELPECLLPEIEEGIRAVEAELGKKFGHPEFPLLVSVRSGSRVSMPGMMETVLDLGLNDDTIMGLAQCLGSEWSAYDSYRRFIQMYSNVVHEVDSYHFETIMADYRKKEEVESDTQLSLPSLKGMCKDFKRVFATCTHNSFPDDPWHQLQQAIMAVFRSWDSDKARAYRLYHRYPDDWGTAASICSMVFGNRGENSATGVGFTRNPATGKKCFFGEYLRNAQGEDVVGGIRTPQPVNKEQAAISDSKLPSLEETMPVVYSQLLKAADLLEGHYKNMQDVEFTIEEGRLFMLQTRNGKRSAFAAIKIAVEMLREGLITEAQAVQQIDPLQLSQLLAPVFDSNETTVAKRQGRMVATGLNAAPGAACGVAAFTSDVAVRWSKEGKNVVLVREETSPDDFAGMVASKGILTMRGGATSHAAVVARGIGLPCICGCAKLELKPHIGIARIGNMQIKEGDEISIDGSTGEVFVGSLKTSPSELLQVMVHGTKKPEESDLYKAFKIIMDICDNQRALKVYTNADTPHDAKVARALGAEGIGLVRTEHMFLEKERLMEIRRVFFSQDLLMQEKAIERLLPYQRGDLHQMFVIMKGLPLTIRLLDPPRHEFLPHSLQDKSETAQLLGVSVEHLKVLEEKLTEHNPMLGLRGCRLGIIWSNVTKMQCKGIFHAACDAYEEFGRETGSVVPQIMVPLVAHRREFLHQKMLIDSVAKEVFTARGIALTYKVGTMIEVPRAALIADQLAKDGADFFSFGSNDLTQCTFGISRDDAWQFMGPYVEGVPSPAGGTRMQIFCEEPFQTLDEDGVGELMRIAIHGGRSVKPLSIGICGEHGGDPKSIAVCEQMGIDYVSCSPYRVPIARCAAALASIASPRHQPSN